MAGRGRQASAGRGRLLLLGIQAVVLLLLPLSVGGAFGLGIALDAPRDLRPFFIVGGLVGWFALSGLVLGSVLWRMTSRRTQALDKAFRPLALRPRRVGVVSRGYIGSRGGRAVRAWFSKGPQLQLYVDCRSGRRLGVGPANRLTRTAGQMFGNEGIPVGEGYGLWSKDPVWSTAWLEEPGVKERLLALSRVLPGVSPQVLVGPEAVCLQLRYFALNEWTGECDLTVEGVQDWIDHLSALAETLERHPRGSEVEGRLEARQRMDRGWLF